MVETRATRAQAEKQETVSTSELVGAALTGGASLVVLQTVQRAVNFILNQLLLRYVDPEVFGMASIPLDLLLNTALFLSREGFRLALTRVVLVGVPSDHEDFRRFVNLCWVPVLLCPLVSLGSMMILPPGGSLQQTGFLFALSATLEALCEPPYLLCQSGLLTSMRAIPEGIGMLLRSALTFCLLVYVLPREQSLLAFGLAQVGYSLILIAIYWGYIAWIVGKPQAPLKLLSFAHAFPRPPSYSSSSSASGWLDSRQLSLACGMTGQSLLKHLLTQGDKIVLSLGQSFYDQGLYALAQNYGSLAARLLFQPLEESARLVFSRLASSPLSSSDKKGGSDKSDDKALVAMLLSTVVKLVVLVGLVFTCFGFNYTRVLLRILLPSGKRWDEGDAAAWILSWYCFYVLALALNGMTEAFVYAVAKEDQVASLSLSTGLSFAAFAGVTLPLMSRFGTVGLVLANVVGMACRIIYSLYFIHRYFTASTRALALLPHAAVLSAFAASFAVTRASDLRTDMTSLMSAAQHVGIGIACLLVVVLTIAGTERGWLKDLASIRRIAKGESVVVEPGKKSS